MFTIKAEKKKKTKAYFEIFWKQPPNRHKATFLMRESTIKMS